MQDYPHPSSPAVTAVMRGNRRANTGPEVALRSALHRSGLRFRKDYLVRLPGMRATRIDIAFPRRRVAVFVDGCFWHGCPEHGRVPSTNAQYWPGKLARTRERDLAQTRALEGEGWTVVRCWEHEEIGVTTVRVRAALCGS
jgi:DNA mismatch endonuclease (patch repair protein)